MAPSPMQTACKSAGATLAPAIPSYLPALAPLVEGLAAVDVFELDERLRRALAREQGRLPTSGEALGMMLDHVLAQWGAHNKKIAARHRVFARDGWRCAVPGCTSMQNLHDHHIRFRSAGGTDALENRVTLCHHLRGVHAGLVRCHGSAPDGLSWQMGIRLGVAPRLTYRSGDLRAS